MTDRVKTKLIHRFYLQKLSGNANKPTFTVKSSGSSTIMQLRYAAHNKFPTIDNDRTELVARPTVMQWYPISDQPPAEKMEIFLGASIPKRTDCLWVT